MKTMIIAVGVLASITSCAQQRAVVNSAANPGSMTPATVGAEQVQGPESISDEVRAALAIIKGPEGAAAANDILINRGAFAQIRDCVRAAGYEYFEVDPGLKPSDMVFQGADAEWLFPPDAELAALGGWGYAFDSEAYNRSFASDPKNIDDAQSNYYAGLSPGQQEAYSGVTADCAMKAKFVSTSAYAHGDSILMGARQVFEDIAKTPEFQVFLAKYTECIKSKGFDFSNPAAAFEALDEVTVNRADLERTEAIADAYCRGPIWDEVIALGGDKWRVWLSESAPSLDALRNEFAQLLSNAGIG